MKKITLIFAALLSLTHMMAATTSNAQSFAVETDPTTFAFEGYAVHARMRLADSGEASKWNVGIGAYSLKFPTIFRDIAISNPNHITKLQLQNAEGIFIDRRFGSELDRGLFAGIQIAQHDYRISQNGRHADYSATLIMPRIGYELPIGETGWYVMPWAGIGYLDPDKSIVTLENDRFKTNNWLPFATLHIGKRF